MPSWMYGLLALTAAPLSLVMVRASPAGGSCGNEGGTTPPPCRVPSWPATWQMNASTIIMPCNYTGYQDPATVAGWGIVDFDWSNNLAGWSGSTPMNNDERQLVQAQMITQSPLTAPYTKVFIYRNSVYAYPWFTSVRTILDNPDYAPWFLMFNGTGPWTSPNCDVDYDPPLCTQYFHTQMDTPKPGTTWGPEGRPQGGYGKCYPPNNKTGCDCGTKPCGFYVFNHSSTVIINNQSFQDWWLNDFMFNEIGSSPDVHGFYWDDTWYSGGVGDDPFPHMVQDMGLTTQDLLQLTASYNANMAVLRNKTIAAGKFAWQLLTNEHVRTPPASTSAECESDLRAYCQAGAQVQHEAMYYALSRSQGGGGGSPKEPFSNCSVFNCTCKGEADFYGIDGSFGCADKGAQNWWVHEAKPCANPGYSCCTTDDYTKKDPPYPGCKPPTPPLSIEQDMVNFLLIRGDYAWLGHGWQGCAQPLADQGGGYPFPQEFHTDFGTPLGLCAETAAGSGVFAREFTKATVKMDCATGTPTIEMKD